MLISVFTATFNKAFLLKNLYESLCNQTFNDFEWLVVDDCSTDDTQSVIKKFIEEKKISIQYIRQQFNGGKHRALNVGVFKANGELFFNVDHDDYLPNKSLEIISQEYKKIIGKDDFAAISGIRQSILSGTRIGGQLDWSEMDCDAFDLRFKYKVKGDMAEVFRTCVLKNYPFPEFENEQFLDEGLVWWRIAQNYKIHYFNKPIYLCEYREDGVTSSVRDYHRNSPCGSMLFCMEQIGYKKVSLESKLKSAINYWRYSINYKSDRKEYLSPFWWMWLFYPVGYFFFITDRKKNK